MGTTSFPSQDKAKVHDDDDDDDDVHTSNTQVHDEEVHSGAVLTLGLTQCKEQDHIAHHNH